MKTPEHDRPMWKRLVVPVAIFLSFCAAAIVFWRITGNRFFVFNFGYIGLAVGIGVGLHTLLPRKRKPEGRRVAQLLVGLYLLGYLGLIRAENLQLEGLFFYLLAGFFSGSVIHYLVAKVFGPLLYGRGWCGWSCWTAMVLDFLPFRKNPSGRAQRKWEWIRYVHFGLSVTLVAVLWLVFRYRPGTTGRTSLVWLITGNALYFVIAVVLAFALKDNRAFCKYVCPVTPILKLTSRFALLKIAGKKDLCTGCGACVKACPMNVNVLEYVQNGERVLSTECIFCMTCMSVCPAEALGTTFNLDIGGRERLVRKDGPPKKRLAV